MERDRPRWRHIGPDSRDRVSKAGPRSRSPSTRTGHGRELRGARPLPAPGHIRCPEGLKGQIAGGCWLCWTPSGCRSSSWKSSVVGHGSLDTALVVMVQPVCTQTGTFCIFVFCGGHQGFCQRLAKGMSWRSLRPCADEIVLVVRPRGAADTRQSPGAHHLASQK